MVPAMIYLIGMPTAVVVGTSLFQICFVAAATGFLHAYLNHSVDILLALLLIAGGVVGAQFGTRFGVRLKAEQTRILLALLVLLVAASSPTTSSSRRVMSTPSPSAEPRTLSIAGLLAALLPLGAAIWALRHRRPRRHRAARLVYAGTIELLALPPLLANALGFAAGVNLSFVGHRRWTFGGGPPVAARRSLARFWSVALVGFGLNSLFVQLVTGTLGPALWLGHPADRRRDAGADLHAQQMWAFRAD